MTKGNRMFVETLTIQSVLSRIFFFTKEDQDCLYSHLSSRAVSSIKLYYVIYVFLNAGLYSARDPKNMPNYTRKNVRFKI